MDALRSVLPAGTLSGAPKVRAMEIIDELEPVKRGGYGGAIGYLSYAGDLDTCIHIRTVVVKDGVAHVQAGGGTVADAKPPTSTRSPCDKARGRAGRRSSSRCAAGLADDDARPRPRQLRLVHLQPRPVPGRAGCRGRGRAQRPRDRRRAARPAATTASSSRRGRARRTRPGSRSRPCAASPRRACRRSASASATRRWRRRSAAASCSTSRCTARRRRSSTTGARSSRGCRDPLTVGRYHSLVVDPDLPDCLEPTSPRRRRADGHPPPRAARRGRAVPPGVGADRVRQRAARELPGRRPDHAQRRPHRGDRRASPPGATSAPTKPRAVLAEIMHGDASETQIAGFLIALRTKGETVEELAGLARTMRALATPVAGRPATTCSTRPAPAAGGATFNVSTTAALIAAGAGCARGQARQPLGDQAVGLRRRARGARARGSTSTPRRWRAASRRSASASCSRPPTTRRRASSSRCARSSRCGRSSTSSAR